MYHEYQHERAVLSHFIKFLSAAELSGVIIEVSLFWKEGLFLFNKNALQQIDLPETSKPDFYVGICTSKISGYLLYRSESCEIIDLTGKSQLQFTTSEISVCQHIKQQLTKCVQHPTNEEINFAKSSTHRTDVTIWIDGELRSSIITDAAITTDSIPYICNQILSDKRFRAIELRELPQASIEFTKLSRLTVPLSRKRLASRQLHPSHGLCIKTDSSIGYYLPLVHNCRSFSSVAEQIATLKQEKLPNSNKQKAFCFEFPTSGVLNNPSDTFKPMYGPVLASELVSDSQIKESVELAKTFLQRHTYETGYISPIASLLHTYTNKLDLPRQALTALALSHIGDYDHAKKISHYTQEQVDRQSVQNKALTLAYLSQTAFYLNDPESAYVLAIEAYRLHEQQQFENTITRSQIARSLQLLNHEAGHSLTESLYEKFNRQRKSGISVSLAKFAELITLSKTHDPSFHLEIKCWYTSQQLPDGSFPDSTQSDFVYFRGTSKIVEALAVTELNEVVLAGLSWMRQMQYTSENDYHLYPDRRIDLLGGFRHDYSNRDAWIDSNAHFLIAAHRHLTQ